MEWSWEQESSVWLHENEYHNFNFEIGWVFQGIPMYFNNGDVGHSWSNTWMNKWCEVCKEVYSHIRVWTFQNAT